MEITLDTLVCDILDEYPQAVAVFANHGVHVETECAGVLESPLEMCESMCAVDDFDCLFRDLQALAKE